MAEIRKRFKEARRQRASAGSILEYGVRGSVPLADVALALASKVLPRYGRYGGPGNDILRSGKPTDALDRAFMYHDLGYTLHERKLADRVLAKDIQDLQESGELTKLGSYARVYGAGAKKWFAFTGGGLASASEQQQYHCKFGKCFELPVARKNIPVENPTNTVQTNTFSPVYMAKKSRQNVSRSALRKAVPSKAKKGASRMRKSKKSFSRNRGEGPRSAPVNVWPGGFGTAKFAIGGGRPGPSGRSKNTETLRYKSQDRVYDYTTSATTLTAGTILFNPTFNPTNFVGCPRMAALARLFARYKVEDLVMEVKVKGNSSIQGGWVGYWDPDPNDDPADATISDRVIIATNHKGALEGNWWGKSYFIKAPKKPDLLYCDPTQTETLLNTSHRFVMIATSTAGLTNACNLFTLILHARIKFWDPTIEPLFVPSGTGASDINMASVSGRTAGAPYGTGGMTKTSGAMSIGGSQLNTTLGGDLAQGFAFITCGSGATATRLQLPAGRWYVFFEIAGTTLSALTITITGYTTATAGTANNTATLCWGYCIVNVPTGIAATDTGNYIQISITAASVTASGIRCIACSAGLTRKKPKTVEMRLRELEGKLEAVDAEMERQLDDEKYDVRSVRSSFGDVPLTAQFGNPIVRRF